MEMDFGDLFSSRRKTKEKTVRHAHDAYMTPAPLVEAIVEAVYRYVTTPIIIVEPSCGDGEFIVALRKKWPKAAIVGIDIRPEVREKAIAAGADSFIADDFLKTPPAGGADLIITNPPYSLLCEFIEHALEGMRNDATLVLLQRFGHLVGSREAQTWWLTPLSNGLTPNRQIVDALPVFPRPSFTGGGTDSTEYCVVIFRKGFDNGGRFDPVKWEKPERRGRKRKNVGG